jgi:hypothetical protein
MPNMKPTTMSMVLTWICSWLSCKYIPCTQLANWLGHAPQMICPLGSDINYSSTSCSPTNFLWSLGSSMFVWILIILLSDWLWVMDPYHVTRCLKGKKKFWEANQKHVPKMLEMRMMAAFESTVSATYALRPSKLSATLPSPPVGFNVGGFSQHCGVVVIIPPSRLLSSHARSLERS